MPNQQYSIDNSDRGNANAFTVPGDEDGGVGDDSFAVEAQGNPRQESHQWYIHLDNQFNENVDITVQGSHFADKTMSKAVEDGSAITVNSGGNQAVIDGTTNHSYLEVEVDPANTPGSGDLTVTFQSRKQ
jgi:hypothetical protein